MEIDIFLQQPIHSTDLVVGSNEPKHMEKDLESIDIWDLDILIPEQASRMKEFGKIMDR